MPQGYGQPQVIGSSIPSMSFQRQFKCALKAHSYLKQEKEAASFMQGYSEKTLKIRDDLQNIFVISFTILKRNSKWTQVPDGTVGIKNIF